jgi:hypothetical protein
MSEPEWTSADYDQEDECWQDREYEDMVEKEELDDPLTMAILATRDD